MTRWARICGACVQGVVLGALLFTAILYLISMYGGARIFRYEGF